MPSTNTANTVYAICYTTTTTLLHIYDLKHTFIFYTKSTHILYFSTFTPSYKHCTTSKALHCTSPYLTLKLCYFSAHLVSRRENVSADLNWFGLSETFGSWRRRRSGGEGEGHLVIEEYPIRYSRGEMSTRRGRMRIRVS